MSGFVKNAGKAIKFAKQAHYDAFVSQIVEEDGTPPADASDEALQTLESEGFDISYVFAYTTAGMQTDKDKLQTQCKQLETAAAELYKAADKGAPVAPNCLSLTLAANTLKKKLVGCYRDCLGHVTLAHLCKAGSVAPLNSTAGEFGEAVWRLILGRKLVHTLISLVTFKGYEASEDKGGEDEEEEEEDSDGDDPEEDHLQYLKALLSLAAYIATPASFTTDRATGDLPTNTSDSPTNIDLNFVLTAQEWGVLVSILHVNYGDLRVVGPLISLMLHCQTVAKQAAREAQALTQGGTGDDSTEMAWANGAAGFDTALRAMFDTTTTAAAAAAVDAKGKRLPANPHILPYVPDEVGGITDLLQKVASIHKRNEILQQQVAAMLS
jgi:hypothetical protein